MKIFVKKQKDDSKFSTSYGNQDKFIKDNIWYKIDAFGYEGASEYFTSELLQFTNIANYVPYSLYQHNANGVLKNGCSSENFLKTDESLVTADRLFKMHYGSHYVKNFTNLSADERVEFFLIG